MCPVSVSHEAWCNIGKYWSKVVCCAAFIIPRKSNCPQLGLSQPQADRDEQHISGRQKRTLTPASKQAVRARALLRPQNGALRTRPSPTPQQDHNKGLCVASTSGQARASQPVPEPIPLIPCRPKTHDESMYHTLRQCAARRRTQRLWSARLALSSLVTCTEGRREEKVRCDCFGLWKMI